MRVWLVTMATVLVAACGTNEPQDREFSLQIRDGQLVDSRESLKVSRGDRVTLVVNSDASVNLHLHGYDISASVAPGNPATIGLTANATGSFPLTIHRQSSFNHDLGHATHAATVPALDGMSVAIAVHVDAADGFNVHIMSKGFSFAPERVNEAHVPGEGHAHIYLDGIKIGRVYGPYYHLTGVSAGEHEVKVTLNANSHERYARAGAPLAAVEVIAVDYGPVATDHADHEQEDVTLLRLEVRP